MTLSGPQPWGVPVWLCEDDGGAKDRQEGAAGFGVVWQDGVQRRRSLQTAMVAWIGWTTRQRKTRALGLVVCRPAVSRLVANAASWAYADRR
jgi:hypothetical protein